MNTKPTFSTGIKGKLISAMCMLLVAVIMVVSSTYAWFTLSTAPEVTGISTAIGANGALEIKLNDTSTTLVNATNTTWGNIVELGDVGYGLQMISLLPSTLNTVISGTIDRTNPLLYPEYGADGRPGDATTKAMTGKYDAYTSNFLPFDTGEGYGVLGVGAASGMTDRQMAFRNAKSAANNAMTLATNKVASSLKINGGTLAGIVVTKVAASDASSMVVTSDQVASMWAIIESFQAALEDIESAYEQLIIAVAASDEAGTDDTLYTTVKTAFEAGSMSLSSLPAEVSTMLSGTAVLSGINDYQSLVSEVETAADVFDALQDSDGSWTETDWNGISPVINVLINYSASGQVKVNGIDLNGVDKDALINQIIDDVMAGNGVTLELGDGSGLYVSMADQCGNFETKITIPEITYGGINAKNMVATMKTASTQNPPFLSGAATYVSTTLRSPSSESGDADMPLTEFYGYILDFTFQTNASGSNLLLQTEAVDRIYEGNDNELTQGSGSTMVFTPATTDVSTEMIQNLMSCIRVVFFTDTAILAEARLDSSNATADADEGNAVTANLYLYKDSALVTDQNNAVISALPQNTETNISVLVYLDGATLQNKDVAATTAQTASGVLNLQFSSSAELIPMEYGGLHIEGTPTT